VRFDSLAVPELNGDHGSWSNQDRCCDEPVETIDSLSLSLRWYLAYIVDASPNPQPRDDVLYKDSVYHTSRVLSHPLNTKLLKKNRLQTEAKPCLALSSSQTTAHAIGGVNHGPMLKLSSRLCCRVQLCWLPVNRSSEGDTQSCCIVIAAGTSLITIRSLSVPLIGYTVGVEMGGASPWWCVLLLHKRSRSVVSHLIRTGS
jgi:hypothetical protein